MPKQPNVTLPDLSQTYAIVTGANTGIGKETARALAKAGAHLVLACRSAERALPVVEELKAESGNEAIEFMPLDLGDLASVRAFTEAFLSTDRPLDLLVNNAGLAGSQGTTVDGFETHFGVNHLGPFLLTELLLERLQASAPARIVHVASRAHRRVNAWSWEGLQQPTVTRVGMAEYSVSKLANILYAAEQARRLEGSGISVASLHPGVVASDVWRGLPWPLEGLMKLFMIGVEEGAQTTLRCCIDPEVVTHSGAYWNEQRREEPTALAQDVALQDELVARSRAWVGLD